MYELRTMFLRQKDVVNSLMKLAPDLFNNVIIGQGQLQLIMKQILFLQYVGAAAILVK